MNEFTPVTPIKASTPSPAVILERIMGRIDTMTEIYAVTFSKDGSAIVWIAGDDRGCFQAAAAITNLGNRLMTGTPIPPNKTS